MTRKKIAIIDPVGSKAGMDHYDKALLSALQEYGVDGNLYSDFDWKEFPERSFPFYKLRQDSFVIRLLLLAFNYNKSIHHISKSGCTSVIVHLFHFNRMDVRLLRKLRNAGLQTVIIVHDVESFVGRTNEDRRRLICESLADVIVVHNTYTFESLSSNISEHAKGKINIIPHGDFLRLNEQGLSQSEARRRIDISTDKILVLFFGMIKPNKGLDILLKAWKSIHSSAVLIVAGRLRRMSFKKFQRTIDEDLTGTDIKLMIRQIPNEERHSLFRAADIIVLPYTHIYQSGVLLMAMSYKVPVIASRLEAIEEVIQDGYNGILVEPGNPERLAEAIDKLASDSVLRNQLSANAMETLKANHSWKEIAGKFAALIS